MCSVLSRQKTLLLVNSVATSEGSLYNLTALEPSSRYDRVAFLLFFLSFFFFYCTTYLYQFSLCRTSPHRLANVQLYSRSYQNVDSNYLS